MSKKELFAYLDHNILDKMTKGDPDNVKEFLTKKELIPVFSDETLSEISRSVGFENNFLEILNEISARKIVPVFDGSRWNGQAQIITCDAFDSYDEQQKAIEELENSDFGFMRMLEKFYGGRKEDSFSEICQYGLEEVKDLFTGIAEEIDSIPIPEGCTREQVKELIDYMPTFLNVAYSDMGNMLDKNSSESVIKDFEKAFVVGPKQLKNIKGLGVLKKIWALIEEKMELVDIDTFFGVKPAPYENEPYREKVIQEKVNAIYHQLNVIGYYRDSQIHKSRRFKASFSDMNHAGIASFCHTLLCGDKDLVMKAAAAYEYVGIPTQIVYYKANKASQEGQSSAVLVCT